MDTYSGGEQPFYRNVEPADMHEFMGQDKGKLFSVHTAVFLWQKHHRPEQPMGQRRAGPARRLYPAGYREKDMNMGEIRASC